MPHVHCKKCCLFSVDRDRLDNLCPDGKCMMCKADLPK